MGRENGRGDELGGESRAPIRSAARERQDPFASILGACHETTEATAL